jgi:DNA-binding HxlR family transcriptional regulator
MDAEQPCSIARSLDVLGQRWTLLILRDALDGATRFAEFRASLGVAPDVLTSRLGTLVDAGVLERRPYRDPGDRTRQGYHLTPAGRELLVVLGALQQWGDEHCPYSEGPTILRRSAGDDRPLRVAFVDDAGAEVALEDVAFVKTAAYPVRGQPA